MTPQQVALLMALTTPLWLATAMPALAGGMAATPPMAAASGASEPEQAGVDTVEYDPGDPEIQAAVKQARRTLPVFFKATGAPSNLITHIAVKIELRDGRLREYVWVMPFKALDQGFEGQVNDIPRKVRKVVTGQMLRFSERDIVDWAYYDLHARRMYGNFTTCVPLRKAPTEERETLKRVYGLDCDKP
jgi:uncharacterized protein YegJ (DUF2314 family)